MTERFDTSHPPFNRLSNSQRKQLVGALDVAYFRHGETLIEAGEHCEALYIIIKGSVEESSPSPAGSNEIYAHYTSDDLFDVRAQLEGTSRHRYIAIEDTLCYLLPRQLFVEFYRGNHQFAAYFDTSLARRQQLLEHAQQQQNLAEFILTRIDDGNLQPCLILAQTCSLQAATEQLHQHKMDATLVTLDNGIGIVTRTNLLHAVMLDGLPHHTEVGEVATTPVVSVSKGDYLFNAMLAMTRHKIKRVAVMAGDDVAGMLSLTQILSLFSTHSHVLTLRIARATTVDELAVAASSQQRLVATLFNNGIHTRFVMELIAALNEQIIEKAFQLVVPQPLHAHSCLIVMGSEGRGEQILKTDQDNALILEDGIDWPALPQVMATLTQTLQQLGYPLCPGQVMVNNPKWVKSQSQWLDTLDALIRRGDGNAMMELAILADSHAVAGKRSLLPPLHERLNLHMAEHELLLSAFTRPALHFQLPLSLFGNLKAGKQGLDIKQGGMFPIIHGIRALSLEYGVAVTNTFSRIEQLAERKVLEPQTASNLAESLKLFIKLRLRQQLEQDAGGMLQHLRLEQLSRAERDLLRHSLHVVKKFKQWLGYHYQIRD